MSAVEYTGPYSKEGTILLSSIICSISESILLRLTTSFPMIGSSPISSSHNEIFFISSEFDASDRIDSGDSPRDESKSMFSNSARESCYDSYNFD